MVWVAWAAIQAGRANLGVSFRLLGESLGPIERQPRLAQVAVRCFALFDCLAGCLCNGSDIHLGLRRHIYHCSDLGDPDEMIETIHCGRVSDGGPRGLGDSYRQIADIHLQRLPGAGGVPR